MLLLFDLRNKQQMNISEVIIMLSTAIQSMQKIFPETSFFGNQIINDEIKLAMMNLFGDFLEQGVLKIFGEAKPH
jgi:hypothetical protein